MAGHSKADMSLHYKQSDLEAQAAAVREFQRRMKNDGIESDTTKSADDADLLKRWWARGDSNARPLPCQGEKAPFYPIDESASD